MNLDSIHNLTQMPWAKKLGGTKNRAQYTTPWPLYASPGFVFGFVFQFFVGWGDFAVSIDWNQYHVSILRFACHFLVKFAWRSLPLLPLIIVHYTQTFKMQASIQPEVVLVSRLLSWLLCGIPNRWFRVDTVLVGWLGYDSCAMTHSSSELIPFWLVN